MLIFGVNNDEEPVGLEDAKGISEKISEIIKIKMDPIPQVIMEFYEEQGKEFIILRVLPGLETPYYYFGEGNRTAFVRVGNQSISAGSMELKRLVLRGSNMTYDSLLSQYKLNDYAFTKLRSVYRKRAGQEIEESDFLSFGLVDENGILTNAGALLADDSPIRHSRLFCTRWYGLDKASGIMEAIDHRIEIYSPGGMYDGSQVQNLDTDRVPSGRRNPIIADIFNRMNYMERRGSGFKKIKGDYRKEVNYNKSLEPKFYSDNTSFWVTLYNLNYNVPVEKVAIDGEKVAIDSIIEKCGNAGLTNIMKGSITEFYRYAGDSLVFGRRDIANYLKFSYANAGKVIIAMKKADVIAEVDGKGKGKYLFKI